MRIYIRESIKLKGNRNARMVTYYKPSEYLLVRLISGLLGLMVRSCYYITVFPILIALKILIFLLNCLINLLVLLGTLIKLVLLVVWNALKAIFRAITRKRHD